MAGCRWLAAAAHVIMALVPQEWTSLLQELSAAWQTAVADLSQVLQQPKGALDVVSVRLHDHEVGACKAGMAVLDLIHDQLASRGTSFQWSWLFSVVSWQLLAHPQELPPALHQSHCLHTSSAFSRPRCFMRPSAVALAHTAGTGTGRSPVSLAAPNCLSACRASC